MVQEKGVDSLRTGAQLIESESEHATLDAFAFEDRGLVAIEGSKDAAPRTLLRAPDGTVTEESLKRLDVPANRPTRALLAHRCSGRGLPGGEATAD